MLRPRRFEPSRTHEVVPLLDRQRTRLLTFRAVSIPSASKAFFSRRRYSRATVHSSMGRVRMRAS